MLSHRKSYKYNVLVMTMVQRFVKVVDLFFST